MRDPLLGVGQGRRVLPPQEICRLPRGRRGVSCADGWCLPRPGTAEPCCKTRCKRASRTERSGVGRCVAPLRVTYWKHDDPPLDGDASSSACAGQALQTCCMGSMSMMRRRQRRSHRIARAASPVAPPRLVALRVAKASRVLGCPAHSLRTMASPRLQCRTARQRREPRAGESKPFRSGRMRRESETDRRGRCVAMLATHATHHTKERKLRKSVYVVHPALRPSERRVRRRRRCGAGARLPGHDQAHFKMLKASNM